MNRAVWSPTLFKAAVCRSHTLTPGRDGYTDIYPSLAEMKAIVRDPLAYHYGYKHGTRGTIFLLNGFVEDFNFSAEIAGESKPFSTMMYLSRGREAATL